MAGPVSVALIADSRDDHSLVCALLSQLDGAPFRVQCLPAGGPIAVEMLARRDHDICLLDRCLAVGPDQVLTHALATGRPVLVLTDTEDQAFDDEMLRAGVWDCAVRSNLTASLLGRSIRRAIEHGRQIRALTDAQRALRASEARYRSLVQNAEYGIYRTAVDGTILEANPALARILGCSSADELVGRDLGSFYRDVADRQRLVEAFRDGDRPLPIEVEWRRVDDQNIWVRLSGHAVYGEDDSLDGFEMLAEDVTDIRQLETQFRQSQKMEAIGRLAGGVAHDFNNLLTAMLGYTEMLRDQISADDPRRHDVDEIHKAAERGCALTRQLLTFSRKQVVQPRTMDLNAVVAGFDKMLRRLIGEDIELLTVPESGLDPVRADPGQIEQVLMNLAVNARDAMPDGGRLTIETANVQLDSAYSRAHASVVPGRYVMLAVSDTGCGMTPEVHAHLFEPFFTTKDKSKGSGLGLATVYGIVRQSGGHVWVYSEPGQGSTFKIYLPVVEEAICCTPSVVASVDLALGSETILLVEDEKAVRTLARDVLERYGYRVLVAGNGRDAMVVADTYLGPIDLVLTDVVMPEMSGRELVRTLRPSRPQVRVLYVSGYTDQTIMHQGMLEAGAAFLQKPFTPDSLVQTVRRVLDATVPAL